MDERIRRLLNSKLVPAVLSIVLGIVIMIARRSAVDMLVKIVGGLVIAAGVALVAVHLAGPGREAGDLKTVLVLAGLMALVGILLISFAGNIVDIFPTLMGIYLILNGLSHLTEAYADPDNRAVAAVMGVLVIALGILIVSRPGFLVNMIMVFIGAAFVVNGVTDLLMMKKVRGSLL